MTTQQTLGQQAPTTGEMMPYKQRRDKLRTFLGSSQQDICEGMVSTLQPQQVIDACLTSVQDNPKILDCKPSTIVRSLNEAARVGIVPDTTSGMAYLIPYKDECTYMLGYKGMMALAYRSEKVRAIRARCVYEEDAFEWIEGTEPRLVHSPRMGSTRGKLVAAYAVAELVEGRPAFEVMLSDEIDAIKARSKSKTGPWSTDFDEMAKKTVIRRLCKNLPMADDDMRQRIHAAISADELADTPTRRTTAIDVESESKLDAIRNGESA